MLLQGVKMEQIEGLESVTYSSGRVALFRQMKIRYQNLALQAVGKRAGDNNALMAIMMQQELVKILLHSIDGNTVPKKELEDLDQVFSYEEYLETVEYLNARGTKRGNLMTASETIGEP